MRSLLGALTLLVLAGPLHADIWECEEPGGGKRFTNIKAEARGCKQLTVTPAAPPPPATAPAPRNSDAPRAPGPGSASTSEGFPKVAPQVQQQRDNDRKKILETELANEERNLQEARRLLAEQEAMRHGGENRNAVLLAERLDPFQKRVKGHEDNIANLRRELGNLR
jgi:hypothetical protein